jgi:hypothetical protein
MDGWMDGWMDGLMDGLLHVWLVGQYVVTCFVISLVSLFVGLFILFSW